MQWVVRKLQGKAQGFVLPFYSPPLLYKFLQLGLSHNSYVNHTLDLLWVEEEMRKGEMGERCCVRKGKNEGKKINGVR
jgi:hypothetical protein